MANIIKQLKQGEDVVLPITHEDAVIDSAGVSIKDKIDALAELIKNNTGGKELVHEVEIWADYECTTRPTGEVSHVYVQLNRDFKFNQSVEYGTYGTSDGIRLQVLTPTSEFLGDRYAIHCWVDFESVQQTSYFTAGQVLLCTTYEAMLIDVTGYQTSFGELIPKPEIQRYRGVIANVSNVPLPTILIGFSRFAVNCKKDYDGDLNFKLGLAYGYCLGQSNESIYIPIGRVLIGRQESKIQGDFQSDAYAWRHLVIKGQGNYGFILGIHPDEWSEPAGTYASLEYDSQIYSNGNTWVYRISIQDDGEYDFNIEAIEIYDFKEVPYNLVITGVPVLPTVSGNIRNVTIDTMAYGELTATQLASKLNIQSTDINIECEVVNDYIDVRDSSGSFYTISKSSIPTIWEVESIAPDGTGPEIAIFEPHIESYVPIYNDGREE